MTAGQQTPAPALAIVGPTASGKTALGLALCAGGSAEILNLDAMQVFRGLDIGTAKPTEGERASAPHHLFDIRAPDEPLGAGGYAALASAQVTEIRARGGRPIFVGGSSFYLRTLLEGLSPIPEIPAELRVALRSEADERGLEAMRSELEATDPRWAQAIHPNDRQRLLRGLEVWRHTGRTLSDFQDLPRAGALPGGLKIAVIAPSMAVLEARIALRAKKMLAEGLVEEVRSLLEGGVSPLAHGFAAPGYREVLAELDGRLEEALLEAITRAHRRYARKQRSVFTRIESQLLAEEGADLIEPCRVLLGG